MDTKIALANVTAVVRAYRGTAEEHEILRQSLKALAQACASLESKNDECATESQE